MKKNQSSCQILEDQDLNEVPITTAEYNDILNIQQQILEMLASHDNSNDILSRLCSLAEGLLPNSVASIMLLDDETGLMNVISAPSVPKAGHDALQNLKPGPGGGSCGNAVFKNEPQFVHDTFNDKRWEDIRQLAYDFNLCSCWSMPVRDKDKKAVGTFALSSFEHRSPAPFHKKLLETAASIVNIVLRNIANESRLKLFSTAMQNASDGMVITNKYNQIIEVNQAFEDIYGYKESDVLGKNPNLFASGNHDKEFYTDMWNDIHNSSKWSGEVTNIKADGSKITQWMSISALNDADGNPQNYLAIFSDLTELKNTQKQIEFMAYHDSLTQLYNKTYLEYLIKSGENKTLILLNVNHFSYINTAYGFKLGDDLLKKIALSLKENFHAQSTYRINSDVFALLYEDKIDIEHVVSKIKEYFYNTSFSLKDVTLNISFTYGGVYGNKDILRNCASALKQAKEDGSNRLHIFNEKKDSVSHTKRKAFIASNNTLHKALEQDMLVPYFQGIYDNRTKEIRKFEVLVRIEKDDKIITPYTFLEPARLSGLLPEITKVVIDKSFKAMSENDYTFSINITEDDLNRKYLFDYLEEKTLQYGIEPSRVILEILEGVSTTGKKNHLSQLEKLKSIGFCLAIDDFGAEYSNFERILDLEIDYLKIDAKYIKDIDKNPKSYEIARAITFFAKNAGIPCIAEFVHNESVQEIVEKLEIDYSQGYYFSEPDKELP